MIARTAIVTGASRGIGRAVAERLLDDGVHVALVARSTDALESVAAPYGELALPIPCDLADPVAVDTTVARVRAAFDGAPDVVVNNAGLFSLAPAHETDPARFAEALTTNLAAPFRIIRAFLPAMRERRGGHVVTIGSIADRFAFAGNAAYAASKFGLRGLHEVLRAELIGTGVRATLVSPAPVDTAQWDEIDPDTRPGLPPRASMLRADAVAAAVLYAITQPPDVNVDELRLSRA